MKRDITFFAVELDEYVTINVDVRVNVGIDRDIVNIEIPRSNSHYRIKDILTKNKSTKMKKSTNKGGTK